MSAVDFTAMRSDEFPPDLLNIKFDDPAGLLETNYDNSILLHDLDMKDRPVGMDAGFSLDLLTPDLSCLDTLPRLSAALDADISPQSPLSDTSTSPVTPGRRGHGGVTELHTPPPPLQEKADPAIDIFSPNFGAVLEQKITTGAVTSPVPMMTSSPLLVTAADTQQAPLAVQVLTSSGPVTLTTVTDLPLGQYGLDTQFTVVEPSQLQLQIPSPDGQYMPGPDSTARVLEQASQRVARSPRPRRPSYSSSGYTSPASGYATPRSGSVTPRSGMTTPFSGHSGYATPQGLSSGLVTPPVKPSHHAALSAGADGKPLKVPRHKRESHINAEYRRRSKIQNGIDDIIRLVPTIEPTSKDSKATILTKTATHCRKLTNEVRNKQSEVEVIKQQIETLSEEIRAAQDTLGPGGEEMLTSVPSHLFDVGDVETAASSGVLQMFSDFVRARTLQNWKFWIFWQIIRPLFESYNNSVTTHTQEDFRRSVTSWLEHKMSLTALRRNVFTSLREFSLKSSVMTSPELLKQEALQAALSDPGPVTLPAQPKVIPPIKGAAITVKPVGVTSPALMVTGVPFVHAQQPSCPPISEEEEDDSAMDQS